MLESESRRRSVTLTQWAAIADPYSHTISGWAGIAISHSSAHLTHSTAEYGNVALCCCGLPYARRVFPLTLEPLRLNKLATPVLASLQQGIRVVLKSPTTAIGLAAVTHQNGFTSSIANGLLTLCCKIKREYGVVDHAYFPFVLLYIPVTTRAIDIDNDLTKSVKYLTMHCIERNQNGKR